MHRRTRSSRAIQQRSCGTSLPNRGHSMSIDNIPAVDPSTSTLPMVDPLTTILAQTAEQPAFAGPDKRPVDLVRVAVIGYGYWGPNVVRNLHSLEHCEVI